MNINEMVRKKKIITTTALCKMIGISVPAVILERIGLVPVIRVKNAIYWHSRDVITACGLLEEYFRRQREALSTSRNLVRKERPNKAPSVGGWGWA